MGYIKDGKYTQIKDVNDTMLMREIHAEVDKLYRDKYGKRNPNTLPTKEIEAINHEAMVRVQDRRKGRLVP